jgi:16S rRNA processing protein RimM
MVQKDNFIALGRITSPHGIRGAVNIHSYGDNDAFAHYSHLFLRKAGELARYDIASCRSKKPGSFIVQFRGVSDRNAAEELAGSEVFLDRASLPEPEPDEVYWHDIIGLDVVLVHGERVGRIINILETGGHDVYVVKTGKGGEVLVPAVMDIVTDIDTETGICTIDPPPGLLEANDS